MGSNLSSVESVAVGNNGQIGSYPDPQLLENIPTLWRIMQSVVDGWAAAVSPHQRTIDEASESGDPTYQVLSAWKALQDEFLKCLFSYVMFFTSCDHAYEALYVQLYRANHLLGAHVRHPKQPHRDAFIMKVRRIRDVAIAHMPSNKSHLDAWTGMSWTPFALSRQDDGYYRIEKLTFGPFRHRHRGESKESQDMEISGLFEMHGRCSGYLKSFDDACTSYLSELNDVAKELSRTSGLPDTR